MLHTETDTSGFKNGTEKLLGIFKPMNPGFLSLSSLHDHPDLTIETPKWIARNRKELNDLLNDPDCSRRHLDTGLLNIKTVKFVLTTQNKLIFGPFGHENSENNIPAYAHLAAEKDFRYAQCITNGQAWFTEINQLIAINVSTYEFRASFHSLQFALPHLLCLPLAETLRIIETDCCDRFVRWHFIKRNTLEQHIRENRSDKEDVSTFSSPEKKEVEEQKKFTSTDMLFFANQQTQQRLKQPLESAHSSEKKLHVFCIK
ncbi:hypothetical protein OQJ13_13420 [Legionella sp. PATHC035]|uniref:hypothetical protein n=1 Tax=Legionella sp. PATHC035 TaxID=2992040 RepID=UPI0022431A5C|nr:hypothetical protein [Legionella sp. PATHC035]MCW8409974.1 hypothetical protein [Legionella sp. PATHC035]